MSPFEFFRFSHIQDPAETLIVSAAVAAADQPLRGNSIYILIVALMVVLIRILVISHKLTSLFILFTFPIFGIKYGGGKREIFRACKNFEKPIKFAKIR
jgi:hypothetical protein